MSVRVCNRDGPSDVAVGVMIGFPRARRVLRAPRARLPRTRRGRRRAVQAVVACCVLALLPASWIRLTASGRVVHSVRAAPRAPVALVFGAGLWDGGPSPYLAHRLDAAVGLYRRGTVRAILVSGDNSTTDYDEPDAMRRYLVRHGVPARRIVTDYAGFDTWDTCTRAVRIFGVRRAVLVSQDFHIRRALALCWAAGIDAHGVAVPEPRDLTWYWCATRELPSAVKAAFDAAFTPDPHFPGPREEGISQALAVG
jgi:vancomycin permeability regulator SanA